MLPSPATSLKPFLVDCGYEPSLLREGSDVDLIAFAHQPFDSRSACIAAVDVANEDDVLLQVKRCRVTGAPVVLACSSTSIEWWSQGVIEPVRVGPRIRNNALPAFFRENRAVFHPSSIFRAKTWGRFDPSYQLSFVDLGLLPVLEAEIGRSLDSLILRNVTELKSDLEWHKLSSAQGEWLLQSIFWLVSAKILRDKHVTKFEGLDLTDLATTFDLLAEHHHAQPIAIRTQQQKAALRDRAEDISRFADLSLTTTESLAYVYENTLVSKETRTHLGTHSTPTELVDLIVSKLASRIAGIPPADRHVFEPACGHGAFLVSAARLLTELAPEHCSTSQHRHEYLRRRLHGTEKDSFALEIARLALTLADIPNPNGWDLSNSDMFEGTTLEEGASSARILLANPPFEHFSSEERKDYGRRGVDVELNTKAAEMLRRTLPHLPVGAVFGVVVPQGLLQEKKSEKLRRMMLANFHVSEVLLYPHKRFAFSEAEFAVILGERAAGVFSTRFVWTDPKASAEQDEHHEVVVVPQVELCVDSDLYPPRLKPLWAWIKSAHHIGTLAAFATVGQGLFFKSDQDTADRSSDAPFPGAKLGYLTFPRAALLHDLPQSSWINLDPNAIDRPVTGTTTGTGQVLLNYGRTSRGLWRLKALLDPRGHAVTSRYITIRPKSEELPLEFFWAVLNSPVANAFTYTRLKGRDNLVGVVRQIPIPTSLDSSLRIATAAQQYLLVAKDASNHQSASKTEHEAFMRLDAAVLEAFDLPAHLERSLLDFCSTSVRPGLNFPFTSFYPAHFRDPITYRDYIHITLDWKDTNDRRYDLIDREIAGNLSDTEREELEHLQHLADLRIRLYAPDAFDS